MDVYDRLTNLGEKKKLVDIVAIYGRGQELFRPPTYISCHSVTYLCNTLSHYEWNLITVK
jgi:hypothetical protein